ncbi:hypothetical protein LSCM1_04129 [Leishmania martiniquensis]|uniref:Uncharacterized protein n=1 Tax=Leishmania martiniquensis TaxID=1580590 RepID=A0A836GPI9_9TRYP|nr:hypothetical protein LSCM1_04129 [Leishmania martiniquensis]
MPSISISSTNDVTSTAVSDTSGSFAASTEAKGTANVLTTDAIIRECIKQGFYRNPICNEKLYLHNRGYDSIAPTAFEPYTDVKVLWLEGNGLSVLPCGDGYTQVCLPVRMDPFAAELEGAETGLVEEGAVLAESSVQHVDPNAQPTPRQNASSPKSAAEGAPSLPLTTDVPEEERDAFSSLYPTVRQLYLHNNLFRRMPDLSRFERLDAVNLSGNFFTTVESHCPYYDAAVRRHRASEMSDGASPTSTFASGVRRSPSKSLQREQEQQRQQLSHDPYSTDDTAPPAELTMIASPADAKWERALQLERCRHLADVFSIFCKHSPLPERDAVEETTAEEQQRRALPSFLKQPLAPASEHRNPCSSLRCLSLAGNRLENFEDCLGLLCYHSLAVLDLSHNNISDGEALLLILERLPRLQSLKLSGNPLVRSLPRYRKRVLSRCKGLLHLDDRPVFTEERRIVTAWAIGGEDGEEKERQAIQHERAAAEKKRLEDFRRLLSRHQCSGSAEAPHADYLDAITTAAALAAAADSRDCSIAGGVSRTPRQRRGRPSTFDPDSSSTSSESEDGADANSCGGSGAGGGSAAAMTERPYGSHIVAQDGTSAAAPERIASQHDNKPPRATPNSPSAQRQQQQRVLSSNQRVEAVAPVAAGGGVAGDNDEGDIFIPRAA